MAYNNSRKNLVTKIDREPTDTEPGRSRSLHPTKGWRSSRIAPANNFKKPNLAQRFYARLEGTLMRSAAE